MSKAHRIPFGLSLSKAHRIPFGLSLSKAHLIPFGLSLSKAHRPVRLRQAQAERLLVVCACAFD
ncbi:MAG: hypothetical protein GZ090_12410 [Oxalobacteraceae bacterium]|nr:hypothetical protein [Oxalobacteraceae bacterium]